MQVQCSTDLSVFLVSTLYNIDNAQYYLKMLAIVAGFLASLIFIYSVTFSTDVLSALMICCF